MEVKTQFSRQVYKNPSTNPAKMKQRGSCQVFIHRCTWVQLDLSFKDILKNKKESYFGYFSETLKTLYTLCELKFL